MTSQLDIYSFGRQLIETQDLDPVYVLVHQSKMEGEKLQKWLLGYWCFYHVGTASWVSEQRDYWQAMYDAAESKDWPRSAERRHFRGDNALKSITYLHGKGLDVLFRPFLSGLRMTYASVERHVRQWEGFGPWIAFKVADMLDRLGITSVDFSGCQLFDSPRKAAAMLWGAEQPGTEIPADVTTWAVRRILFKIHDKDAPPRYERKLNVQEAETILCKWKAYCGGHYHVGEDIAACRKGLLRFARTRTAQRLLAAGKEAGLWK